MNFKIIANEFEEALFVYFSTLRFNQKHQFSLRPFIFFQIREQRFNYLIVKIKFTYWALFLSFDKAYSKIYFIVDKCNMMVDIYWIRKVLLFRLWERKVMKSSCTLSFLLTSWRRDREKEIGHILTYIHDHFRYITFNEFKFKKKSFHVKRWNCFKKYYR